MLEAPTRIAGVNLKRRASPRLLLGLSLLALTLALAACLALLVKPRSPVRLLPDGSRVTLEGVTYGSQHEFDPRRWWERWLDWLPVARQNVGTLTQSLMTPPDSLVFWLRHDPTQLTPPGSGVIADAHGCWFEPSESRVRPAVGARQPGSRHVVVTFAAFPRRASSARFGLYDPYGRGPSASFRAPIPTMQKRPSWATGAPIPASVRNADLTFTLHELLHREELLRRREAAVFRVTRNGRLQPDWHARRIIVEDATGNVVVSRTHGLMDDGTVRFAGLCRRELAWKLKVTFERRRSGRTLEFRTVGFMVKP